jgi:glycosyltransferase involved in cell wall biosynthesis
MITDVFFPRVNGVSTSIRTFITELNKLGVQVTLIAPDYPGQEMKDNDLDVIRIPSGKVILDPEDRLMKSREIRKKLEYLRSRKYDLVHIQTPFAAHYSGLWLARRLNLPVVESYHTFFEEYLYNYIPFLPKSWLRFVARYFSRSQCNEVNTIIVPSIAMKEVLEGYGVKTDMKILPTGIDLREFGKGDGRSFRDKHGIPHDRPVISFIGRVAFEKNIGFLINVVERLKNFGSNVLFVVAGEGPARHSLSRQAEQLGLANHVKFIGYLSRNGDLQDCYSAADIFVFASHTETQGLVLLEAMAIGTPVVSTAIMGTRDILNTEQGAVVSEPDVEDFSRKVLGLLHEPGMRNLLAKEAKMLANNWQASRFACELKVLYEDVREESSSFID